jgi:hypothetical protein
MFWTENIIIALAGLLIALLIIVISIVLSGRTLW